MKQSVAVSIYLYICIGPIYQFSASRRDWTGDNADYASSVGVLRKFVLFSWNDVEIALIRWTRWKNLAHLINFVFRL